MKYWLNLEDRKEQDIETFSEGAAKIGLTIFADSDYPNLICICSGTDTQEMFQKMEGGVVVRVSGEHQQPKSKIFFIFILAEKIRNIFSFIF